MRPGKAMIIGSGIGGLGSACLLAKAGWDVTVLEKNEQIGGRVGSYEAKGFRFDTGPSWFLMPDVFEHFFQLMGEDIDKHLKLRKLTPSYRTFFKDTFLKAEIYPELEKNLDTIEQLEAGAGQELKNYMSQMEYQYGVAKERFLYKNYDSLLDFLTPEMMKDGRKLKAFSSMDRYGYRHFRSEAVRKLIQYPAVFLGSSPYRTPALYGILNHVIFSMGVYYPEGGMYKVVEALRKLAENHDVKFRTNSPVSKILVEQGEAKGVVLENGRSLKTDIVISSADIYHTEAKLLNRPYRSKSERYWQTRTMAPSALLMYLGVKGKVPELSHHNLLFSKDWQQNFKELFGKSRWPKDPSFYVCKPSETDPSVAPKNHENLFVLVPVAAGLRYDTELLEHYSDKILQTIENHMFVSSLRERIVYKKLFSVKDFEQRYNSYKGSALGLSHTLRQTAVFRPNNINPKVRHLYYVGAGTNPGIGVPTCLISAELMYKRLIGDTSPGPLQRL